MSNKHDNIYNILGKLNALAPQEEPKGNILKEIQPAKKDIVSQLNDRYSSFKQQLNEATLAEKDLGKHNNATTGFKALAKKAGGGEKGAKIAGAQLAKMRAKGQVDEGSIHGYYVTKVNDKHDQLKIIAWLRKQVGLPKNAPLYFDDVDLVWGDKTIVRDALANPKLKMNDLLTAVVSATGKGQALSNQGGYYREAMDPEAQVEGFDDPDMDNGEYDMEGKFSKNDLHTIIRNASELEQHLGDDENMPEWVQAKLTQAKGMIDAATEYMLSSEEQSHEHETGKEGFHPDEAMAEDVQPKTDDKFRAYLASRKGASKKEPDSKDRVDEIDKETPDFDPLNRFERVPAWKRLGMGEKPGRPSTRSQHVKGNPAGTYLGGEYEHHFGDEPMDDELEEMIKEELPKPRLVKGKGPYGSDFKHDDDDDNDDDDGSDSKDKKAKEPKKKGRPKKNIGPERVTSKAWKHKDGRRAATESFDDEDEHEDPMSFTHGANTTGTSLKGYITASYDELVRVFGDPDVGPNDRNQDKVTCVWELTFGDGTVATIYDWKEGKTPMGKYSWHIGGRNNNAEHMIHSAFELMMEDADRISETSKSIKLDTFVEDTMAELDGILLAEKAVSQQQQKFMGMVHAMQTGHKVKGASSELKKVAKEMGKSDAKDFASTKHKGLPKKVNESITYESADSGLNAICHRYSREVKDFMTSGDMHDDLFHALYDHYFDDMPYGVKKARDGDPYVWVADRFHDDMGSNHYAHADVDVEEADYGSSAATLEMENTGMTNELEELARLAGLGHHHEEIDECTYTAEGEHCPVHGLEECGGMFEAKKAKPDFLDVDKDGDKKEPFKKAVKDKEEDDKLDEAMSELRRLSGMTKSTREHVAHAIPNMYAFEKTVTEEFANEPDEQYVDTDTIVNQGGDLNRKKSQYAGLPRQGDNPMMETRLSRMYESIKIKKK
jgi:hypothetical protein